MNLLHIFPILSGLLIGAALANNLPKVDLGYEIHQATFNSTGQYYNFSNVRYGAPPLGALRFSMPQAPSTKHKVFNDGSQGVSCIQAVPEWTALSDAWIVNGTAGLNLSTPYSPPKIYSLPPVVGTPETEDCLFLDLMVPKKIFDQAGKGSGAPVLLWIHGGGYTLGSKTLYSPSAAGLISRSQEEGSEGIIWIGINYRLGIFGFLSGPTLQSNGTANAGLHDQRFAIEWVQKYIHLFGGDPKRVTIMGESAGGGSVMHQITAYGGLNGTPFHQAIVQSPGFQMTPSSYHQESIFNKFINFANVSTLQEARGLSSKKLQLVNAQIVGESYPYGTFTFNPVVDGDFVPALPGKLLLQGSYDPSLKVMVGHNILEGLEFMDPWAQNQKVFAEDLRIYEPTITKETVDYISNVLYPAKYDGSMPYTDATYRMELLITEAFFTCNTNWLATAFGPQSWSYIFSVPPSLHGEDIPFTYFDGNRSAVTNVTVAETMQRYFARFTEFGNPNGPKTPFFPRYGDDTTCLNLNQTFINTIKDNAANPRCTWWQKGLYC